MSNTLVTVRTFVFRVIISVAATEIAVGAVMLNNTIFNFNYFFVFNALGVATASLTLLTIPVMIWVSRTRKGSFITMISVEAGWTFILWVLWLASAADTISTLPDNLCRLIYSATLFTFDSFLDDTALCNETQAFTALAFIGWGLLFFYNMALIFLALRQQTRGHTDVWSGHVLETDFSAPGPNASAATYPTEGKVMGAHQPGLVVPHAYPPAMTTQDGGYAGQPVGGNFNVAQLTGTTAASTHLPEV